ncbi:MAG: ATP-dependent Clp protease ATP-binding subunit [Clostridia bacterium]|nr:ATP-dependent Clp protease ATP-binding subunit [Clostridia bacterium]
MLCSRCKRRPAAIFMAANKKQAKPSKGYCLICASELGIKPINDIMHQFGISQEEFENMAEQFDIFAEEFGDGFDPEEYDNPAGGAIPFPFIKNIFSPFESVDVDNDIAKGKNTSGGKKKRKKTLETYCYNFTEKARRKELDNIIGREKEIARVIQILSRRTKNNPCLIGEPGVGKTAIAEGLAIKIAKGQVPFRLKDKEIYLLDLTALVAGTQFRGQFEGRIKNLIEEVKSQKNIILFIDEVHNLVGAGDSERGSMNAANILKPALSRGEVQVIGATTFSEYRKYIEKDAALERRFQPVIIEEPSITKTVNLLLGIRSYYEKYHRVKVPKELITKVVTLSERYITDRFLPDKAIDLLDEACTYAALRNKNMEIYDRIIEQINLLKEIEARLEDPINENIDYKKLAEIRSDIDRLNLEKDELKPAAFSSMVSEDDVANVIELWTGIPAAKVKETELKKLVKIEAKLKKKIVGQNEAVKLVASATKRSRLQINPRRHPASFIFVGPTGVGKTELVKVLAEELFDNRESLIRLDMSEFMEKHSVSRIIGAPPGYVGYDESGQITEKVRRRPHSILLLDEIEKAHPDVMNILLQILDEGKITDSQGRSVNFENTIIIMTSNAGSSLKSGAVGFAKSVNDLTREKAEKALSDFLRPEFISRVDEIVVFNSLTEEDLKKIAVLMLNEYSAILREKGIDLNYNALVPSWLAKKSKDGKHGARDLRSTIRKEIEDKIADVLIKESDNAVSSIDINLKNDDITVQASYIGSA